MATTKEIDSMSKKHKCECGTELHQSISHCFDCARRNPLYVYQSRCWVCLEVAFGLSSDRKCNKCSAIG